METLTRNPSPFDCDLSRTNPGFKSSVTQHTSSFIPFQLFIYFIYFVHDGVDE